MFFDGDNDYADGSPVDTVPAADTRPASDSATLAAPDSIYEFRSGDDEMDRMFDAMVSEIEEKRTCVCQLDALLAQLQSHPKEFDAEDIAIVNDRLTMRREDLAELQKRHAEGVALYRERIMHAEQLIMERSHVLRELDHTLGVLSNDDVLLQHFASKQGFLQKSLVETKQQLCQRFMKEAASVAEAPRSEVPPSPADGSRQLQRTSNHSHHTRR